MYVLHECLICMFCVYLLKMLSYTANKEITPPPPMQNGSRGLQIVWGRGGGVDSLLAMQIRISGGSNPYPSCKAMPHRASQLIWCWRNVLLKKRVWKLCISPPPTPNPSKMIKLLRILFRSNKKWGRKAPIWTKWGQKGIRRYQNAAKRAPNGGRIAP